MMPSRHPAPDVVECVRRAVALLSCAVVLSPTFVAAAAVEDRAPRVVVLEVPQSAPPGLCSSVQGAVERVQLLWGGCTVDAGAQSPSSIVVRATAKTDGSVELRRAGRNVVLLRTDDPSWEGGLGEILAPAGPTGEAASGTLAVRAATAEMEGADVWVDERWVGAAPLTISVPPGGHELAAEKDGYAGATWRVKIEAMKTTDEVLVLTPSTGWIVANVDPACTATVTVDGLAARGDVIEVAPGDHVLSAIADAYVATSAMVHVSASERVRATVRLGAAEEFVAIRGGRFSFGYDATLDVDPGVGAVPAVQLTVLPFAVMRTPVTVGSYQRCVKAGRCRARPTSEWCHPPSSASSRLPVNCVDYESASTYCAWLGARLPKAEEWEFVAKDGQARAFPWGNERDPEPMRAERASPVAVGERTYRSCGPVFDLVGNGWQWVAGTVPEVRGGFCWAGSGCLPVWSRYALAPQFSHPAVTFRCARDRS